MSLCGVILQFWLRDIIPFCSCHSTVSVGLIHEVGGNRGEKKVIFNVAADIARYIM
jgi:hypothetical protein